MAPSELPRREDSTLEGILEACLHPSTRERYESGLRQIVKWVHLTGATQLLKEDGMIDLDHFEFDHFTEFVVWTLNNTDVKVSTMSGYRSALRWYYKREDKQLPADYDTKLKQRVGMRSITAGEAQSSSIKDSGKRPLCFSLYSTLARDSLMSKTDQTGSKRRDPRHVYANPARPAVCVVLALAIYLACHPSMSPGPLFPGANQKNRFSKGLRSMALGTLGETAAEIGTHSIRKGAATYVCSGSTSGPSVISVCLRCGWSLGHVVERYMHYEKAGDQFVGRVVAGLPLNTSGFAVLPPHFAAENDQFVARAIRVVFPSLVGHPSLQAVLALCLASLVHHEKFLKVTLPMKHSLLQTALFRGTTLIDSLRPRVVLASGVLQPTGLPPYVQIYCQLDENRAALTTLPTTVLAGVRELLDEHDLATGTVTPAFIENVVSNLYTRLKPLSPTHTITPTTMPARATSLHMWGEKLHKLPESFEFPTVDTATAWALWLLGKDGVTNFPFKSIEPIDLAKK
ncbi:hypothetical protein As57867_024137, partial [Aphanomyces stellatus]